MGRDTLGLRDDQVSDSEKDRNFIGYTPLQNHGPGPAHTSCWVPSHPDGGSVPDRRGNVRGLFCATSKGISYHFVHSAMRDGG